MRALGIVAILAVGLAGCGGDSGIAGTWELDAEYFKAEATKASDPKLEELPEIARAAAKKGRDKGLSAVTSKMFVLVVAADGTYTGTSDNPITGASTTKGTWKESDGGYAFQQTHQSGEEKTSAPFQATMKDGFLYGKPDASMGHDIRLKRK